MGTTYFPQDLIELLGEIGSVDGKNLTDIANTYHQFGRLSANTYDGLWFNMGTFDDLLNAAIHRRECLQRFKSPASLR